MHVLHACVCVCAFIRSLVRSFTLFTTVKPNFDYLDRNFFIACEIEVFFCYLCERSYLMFISCIMLIFFHTQFTCIAWSLNVMDVQLQSICTGMK